MTVRSCHDGVTASSIGAIHDDAGAGAGAGDGDGDGDDDGAAGAGDGDGDDKVAIQAEWLFIRKRVDHSA